MNPDTAKKLGQKGVDEYWRLQQHLMTQLGTHSLTDGWDFYTRCTVEKQDRQFSIWCDGAPIDGIASTRRDVIRALFDNACAQLGR